MRLPLFKRIFKSDYTPEQQGLIEKLSSSINIGMELIYDALNKKLTLIDNIASTVRDVVITSNVSGVPLTTTQFSLDLTTQVMGVQVIRAENLTNSSIYPSSGVFITYSQSGNNIIINHITGLQANNQYRLKVIAWHV